MPAPNAPAAAILNAATRFESSPLSSLGAACNLRVLGCRGGARSPGGATKPADRSGSNAATACNRRRMDASEVNRDAATSPCLKRTRLVSLWHSFWHHCLAGSHRDNEVFCPLGLVSASFGGVPELSCGNRASRSDAEADAIVGRRCQRQGLHGPATGPRRREAPRRGPHAATECRRRSPKTPE
jgi:hypothetical protein